MIGKEAAEELDGQAGFIPGVANSLDLAMWAETAEENDNLQGRHSQS